MKIIPLSDNYYSLWDDFCKESDDTWFWHSSDWLKFISGYQSEPKVLNLSFFIEENNKLKAIIPLMLETIKSNEKITREFSFSGWATPIPAFHNSLSSPEKEKIYWIILNEIDRLAKKEKVSFSRFVMSPLSVNYLNKNTSLHLKAFSSFDYFDIPVYSQILNLSKNLNEIKRNIRHGHKAAITKGEKTLTTAIFDSFNITPEIFDQYIGLYIKKFGAPKRSSSTFNIMFERIKNKNDFLVFAYQNKYPIGVSYFYAFKNNAFYGSACNDPNIKNVPISHTIQWTAIKWMKEKKINFYEIGYQPYQSPNDKQLNISHFKKGFGGLIVPFFMKEKKYNHE